MRFMVVAYAASFIHPTLKHVFDTFEEANKFFLKAQKDFVENNWSHSNPPEMFIMKQIDPETYKRCQEQEPSP